MARTATDIATIEYGVTILSLGILWIICLVLIRRQKDPLRRPFLWLKWAMPFYLLYAACLIAIRLVDIFNENIAIDPSAIIGRLSPASSIFSDIADLFALLCIVELAVGFLRVLAKASRHELIRYPTLFAIATLSILAILTFGLDESHTTKFLNDSATEASWVSIGNLYGSWDIIYWICSIAVTILSLFILYYSEQQKRLRGTIRLYFAATMLNCVRYTWIVYTDIKWTINIQPTTENPPWFYVVDPVLNSWITVAMFAVLVAIGDKKPGLRSNIITDVQQQQEQQQQQQQQQWQHPVGLGGSYNSYQQPGQAEMVGSTPLVWGGLPQPQPRYQLPQYRHQYQPQQQQPQQLQSPSTQSQNTIGAFPPIEAGSHPLHEADASSGHGGMGWGRQVSYHPPGGPQLNPLLYEVPGTPDQKG